MKWVKRIAAGLGGLFVLAFVLVLVRFYVFLPASRAPIDVKAPATPEAIARGKYLANSVAACMGCHSRVDEDKPGEPMHPGTAGGGRDFATLTGFPGHVRAPNITPDAEHGIGAWTDGEVLRAMREGIARDGRPLFPFMPYPNFRKALSDEDALSIIAYLRTLPPLATDPGPMQVDFPVVMFARAAPKPVTTSPPPAPTDPVERGKWILTAASCPDCHTPRERGEPIAGKDFAGGNAFQTAKGTVYAANITSDKATGIGAYSDADLVRVFNEGVGKSGRSLYIMPWAYYGTMTDDDKRALIAALRTIPAVNNLVPPSTIPK